MKPHNAVHPDLLSAQELAFKPMRLTYTKLIQDAQSQEYGACSFEMNQKTIKFRVAKITPTKIGQFVTFWKRIGSGPIMPYDMSDSFDLLVISVRNAKHFGQFVFPKSVLWQKGLVSKDQNGGKRAMRIYPPWDITDSPQAKKNSGLAATVFC
ncbi:MAG: MepB family protein [Candidatus Babeliales bacterium]|nr:MepB family protein [Candidatus Babeliales bacterium]